MPETFKYYFPSSDTITTCPICYILLVKAWGQQPTCGGQGWYHDECEVVVEYPRGAASPAPPLAHMSLTSSQAQDVQRSGCMDYHCCCIFWLWSGTLCEGTNQIDRLHMPGPQPSLWCQEAVLIWWIGAHQQGWGPGAWPVEFAWKELRVGWVVEACLTNQCVQGQNSYKRIEPVLIN